MKHFAFLAILLLTIGGASGSLAVAGGDAFAHAHGSHSECPLPKSAADVVACAVSESPIAKRSRLAADQSKSLVEVARQIPNPEIDIQSATGRQDGGEASSTDIGLLQPIEWGGRREARISSAEAQGKILNAEEREVQADLVRETIRNLHRLRQLEVEKTLLIETVETLQRIISQQTSRPALTPDQQVTLTVYRMALADTKIKQSEMFEEERKLEHYFHVSTGHSLTELKPILPSAPALWPDIPAKPLESSPGILKAMADRDFALARLSKERSLAWPQLRIGPMAKLERNSIQNENMYGLRLMMDLPLLNQNSAGRAFAAVGVAQSETLIELTRDEESHERAEQAKVYLSAVEALKSSPTVEAIQKDFNRSQAAVRRGLISGALLIELHRQRSELIRSRNERELKAIEALWLINKFDGRIFTEKP